MKNLKNNSNEMKTEVETFIIEETAELIYDDEKLVKYNDLVNELGLKGQTQIIKPEKSPIPFLHMNQSLVRVFETLCPRKVNIEDYNCTPIPVEILELVALSKREEYFDQIQIWYDDKTPDPACIGIKQNLYAYVYKEQRGGEYVRHNNLTNKQKEQYDKDPLLYFSGVEISAQYLLGKWADVKQSLSELKKRAIDRYTESKRIELRKKIKEQTEELNYLEEISHEYFN